MTLLEKGGLFPYGRLTDASVMVTTTAELETALADGEKCISLAAGTFVIANAQTLTGIKLQGCNKNQTLLDMGALYTVTGGTIIKDIGFLGTIRAFNVTGNCYFQTCDFANSTTEMVFVNSGNDECYFDRCCFIGIAGAGTGIQEQTSGADIYISSCLFTDLLVGYQTRGLKPDVVTDCIFDNCTDAIQFTQASGTSSTITVKGCIFQDNTQDFDGNTRDYKMVITNNTFINSTDILDFSDDSNIIFTNNYIDGTEPTTFTAYNGDNLRSKNNFFEITRTAASSACTGYESIVNCDTTAANLSLTIPSISLASAGHIIRIVKSAGANALSITTTATARRYTDDIVIAAQETLIWNGVRWTFKEDLTQEFAFFDTASDIVLATTAAVAITWQSLKGLNWLVSGDATRISPGYGGNFLITGVIAFEGDATGTRTIIVQKSGNAAFRDLSNQTSVSAVDAYLPFRAIFNMSSSDYFQVFAQQDSGGDLNALAAFTITFLRVILLN